jgi:glutaredoxin
MAIKVLGCGNAWVHVGGHPCWRVEKALSDMGIEYERVKLPTRRKSREQIKSLTGQTLYPAIQFEDGSVYREESKDMVRTIREGKLMERAGAATTPEASG